MKWIKQIHLTESVLEKLKQVSSLKSFNLKTTLFYEGQTPIVAYLVIKGSIQLSRKKKIHNTLRPGAILGIEEVMAKETSDVTAEVLGNSTLYFLDRTTLLEIANGNNNLLKSILIHNEDQMVL